MRQFGEVVPAAVECVVTEYGLPMPGRYMATRRKDGAMYIRISLQSGPTRKWVRPSKVQFEGEYTPVYIDKYTDLRKANV